MNPAAAPPPTTFRLGLSLSGAVSAGTYAAGVLDYLVEALDAWQDSRARGEPDVPDGQVVLDAIAGASAGAYGAALLAVGLRSRFPHVRLSGYRDPPDCQENPLYEAWVRGTGVRDLLQNRDRSDEAFKSLLDGTRVAEVAALALAMPAKSEPFAGGGRTWVADPLRLSFTVTNLDGIPLRFEGTRLPRDIASLRQFADVTRFALRGLGVATSHPVASDEMALDYPADASTLPVRWQALTAAATASAAFPLIFSPRIVDWFTAAYTPLKVPWPPGVSGPPHARFMPMWPQAVPPQMAYVGVDGGVLDNDPVAIVDDNLHGRDPAAPSLTANHGAWTDRAVIMIQPLVDKFDIESPPSSSPSDFGPPHRLLARLASAVWTQARGNVVDFALAQREDCYSRFLIAPTEAAASSRPGTPALAGACLGAFGGYLHEDYRRHDWQLGRCHAREALRTRLTLPAGHGLFSNWTPAQRARFAVPDGPNRGELPIIPLMPHLFDADEKPLAWPAGRDPTAGLEKPLAARLRVVVKGLSRLYLPRCPFGRALILLAWWAWLGRKVRRGVLATMREALAANGL